MRRGRRTLAALLLSAAFLLSCESSCLAKRAKLIDGPIVAQLDAADPATPLAFDHAAYRGLLLKYVDTESGRVDYRGMSYERDVLERYVRRLATVSFDVMPVADRYALLINAYNAITLLLILENYPVDSIRDVDDPWTDRRWTLAGQRVSLDDIEHGLLRPKLRDPRLHFVLNCAAVSCPALWNEPYSGPELQQQLQAAAKRTLNDPRYVRVDGDSVSISALLWWYGDDFTGKHWKPRGDTVTAFVALYNEAVQPQMKGEPMTYDWSLNDKVRADAE